MRPEKQSIVNELAAQAAKATYAIFVDFTKMDMSKTSALRKTLRASGARLEVVPIRMFRVAVKDSSMSDAAKQLRGPTAMIYGAGDAAEVAKAVKTFSTAQKVPVVTSGWVEGRVLTAEEVDRLASLPSKKVMQGMLVGTIAAPMSNLVGVFSQKLASLCYVLNAAKEKKEKAA
ncbi:MAG: 50S ribosomal protein L10 [Bacteroidales bacterium]|nr:50S ribosomal protein L10 [Bacteroidales bacterium]